MLKKLMIFTMVILKQLINILMVTGLIYVVYAGLGTRAVTEPIAAAPQRQTTTTPSANPTSVAPIIVTPTPTPQNIVTVAAQAARATAVATAIGTYTPVPFNWVIPIVITPPLPTTLPANTATATFQAAEATASAFVNGTPTPAPINVWTATPTPFMKPVVGQVATPYVPPPPTATLLPIPSGLVGKILFLSNRSGGPQPLAQPLVYAIDPDGSNLAVLNDDSFYRTALARDAYSADQRYFALVADIRRYFAGKRASGYDLASAIFFYDDQYQVAEQVTIFGIGGAWDPAWSPTREQFALVSDESQHAEIWVINRDGSGLQKLTETNEAAFASQIGKHTFVSDDAHGHPSWSPDGTQLVYWSNQTGRRQLWVMDADGGNAYTLSSTQDDDWDPVWIKYSDPVHKPTPILQIDGK